MGGNGNLDGVYMAGQQQAQVNAVANQVAMGMFVSLYPQLAIYRAAHGYPVEGGLTEDSTPGRVAHEAGAYVAAGMAKLGFHRE